VFWRHPYLIFRQWDGILFCPGDAIGTFCLCPKGTLANDSRCVISSEGRAARRLFGWNLSYVEVCLWSTGFVIHFHGFWKDVRLIDIVEKFWCKYSSIVDQISMFPKYIDAEPYVHGTVLSFARLNGLSIHHISYSPSVFLHSPDIPLRACFRRHFMAGFAIYLMCWWKMYVL